MTWNYRIVKYFDGSGFGLHEVHYDSDGVPKSMTKEPVRFTGETPEEIRESMVLARSDASRRSVLDEPAEWA